LAVKGSVNPRSLKRVVAETLLITPSGALSPGPLSASAVAIGALMGPVGGLLVALGHMLFELPYVVLLVKWAEKLSRAISKYEKPLNLAVAGFIVFFAYGLILDAIAAAHGVVRTSSAMTASTPLGALMVGLVLTAFNPYFLAWWATVGLPLVRGAAAHGGKGFAAMYSSHVWMDYVWLALLAAGGAGLSRITGLYAALLLGLAAVLLVFAANLVARGLLGRRLLPF